MGDDVQEPGVVAASSVSIGARSQPLTNRQLLFLTPPSREADETLKAFLFGYFGVLFGNLLFAVLLVVVGNFQQGLLSWLVIPYLFLAASMGVIAGAVGGVFAFVILKTVDFICGGRLFSERTAVLWLGGLGVYIPFAFFDLLMRGPQSASVVPLSILAGVATQMLFGQLGAIVVWRVQADVFEKRLSTLMRLTKPIPASTGVNDDSLAQTPRMIQLREAAALTFGTQAQFKLWRLFRITLVAAIFLGIDQFWQGNQLLVAAGLFFAIQVPLMCFVMGCFDKLEARKLRKELLLHFSSVFDSGKKIE